MSELAIVQELHNAKRSYNTPIQILPSDNASDGVAQSGALPFSQKKMVRTIEFYSNNRYLISQRDELGREKPFYNIVNAICDIEDAAKDFDTKDVQATSDDQHYVESFLMTKDIYEWMKQVRLGKAINESKEKHTRYGGVLAKKVIKRTDETDPKSETIFVEFPEWKNLTTDQHNIEGGTIIEDHYMTRSELFEKRDAWDEDRIKQALKDMPKSGKTYGRFHIYEMRGLFPRSFYKQAKDGGEADFEDTDYSYQYHVLAEITSKNAISLYAEDDTEKVYKYLPRKKKAGRDFGVGVVEENEQAQIWTNDTVQKQLRAFEHSSRVVVQSASKKLKARNVLTEVDDGQILEHEENKPITTVPLVPPGGMAQFGQMLEQWWTQAQRISSAYDAQSGEKPVAGTAFRLQALQLQQSGSVFKDLQEDLTMFWEDLFNCWFMPYLAKKINKKHILSHEFTPDELQAIDKSFAAFTANQEAIARVNSYTEADLKSGTLHTQDQYDQTMQNAQQSIGQTKGTRFLEVPKNYFKDVNSKITINISGESKDKQQTLDSLMAIMELYAKYPQLATNSILTKLFLEIVEQSNTGISPVSLMSAISEQAQQIQAQQKQQAQGQGKSPIESISYKDAPEDVQIQMAAQAGLKQAPSQQVQPSPTQQTSLQPV